MWVKFILVISSEVLQLSHFLYQCKVVQIIIIPKQDKKTEINNVM